MIVSTKGRYAARMLLDLALHQGDGYVAMKEIAARQQVSKKYLEAFTAPLAAAGILSVRRGKAGGYRLGRAPSEITLWDVLSAVEGPVRAVACLEQDPNSCPRSAFCPTLPAWAGLDRVVRDYLTSVTLARLLDEAGPRPQDPRGVCGI